MEEDIIKVRIEKLNKLKEIGINPYPYKFNKSKNNDQIKKEFQNLNPDEHTNITESVAGRIMLMREMGKITFITLRDEFDDLQIVLKEDLTKNYELLKYLDIGDWLGVTGKVGKTKKGEISIFAEKFEILCKAIKPLPEKYHGISDDEIRYRKRYLDLIMNWETRKNFKIRHEIIRMTREYLYDKGFIELETPILQPVYGGANAKPFITHFNALDCNFYLKISPELYLKRLIVGGYEKVFEITKNFRNEGYDTRHSPEFTMIEWYMAYADYFDMMDMIEELFKKIALKIKGSLKFKYLDYELDFSHFERISMVDAIKKYAGYDVEKMNDEEIKNAILENGGEFEEYFSRGLLINALFEATTEKHLIQPTFIMDHPVEISPLTKIHRNKPGFVERFELFIAGKEIANAYSELNDPIDQRQRFEEQEEMRKKGDEEAMPNDYDFVEAIETGMPPTGGLGFGIDRLVMLMINSDSIKDAIPFPAVKPEELEKE
ncbi:MAG: lysine--tRNA ligase [Candidatus Woesearchaeota archaeon]